MAHRDDDGAGPGADDNASGTAALIELARAYAPSVAARLKLPYSLLFLSTDGAAEGGLGAAWFAAHAPERSSVTAVVNLDAIAGSGPPRLELSGDTARTATPGLVETVREILVAQTGVEPTRPSALRQLVDLAFPFSRYEQAPFVTRGSPRSRSRPLRTAPRASATSRRRSRPPASARSAGRRRTSWMRWSRASRCRPAPRAISISAAGSSAAGRSSSCSSARCCRSLWPRSTCSRAAGAAASVSRPLCAAIAADWASGRGRRAHSACSRCSGRGPAGRRGRRRSTPSGGPPRG